MPVAEALATHLRAGQITVKRDGCTRKVTILIEVYTNTVGTSVLFGGDQDYLDFGDGTKAVLVPQQPNIFLPDLNPDGTNAVAYSFYTIEHIYAGPGVYTISYREPNRNEGVLNMDNSVNTTFYIETKIIIDPAVGCNNTPILKVPPIDRACPGEAFTHNPGAYDPDPGDVLTYRLVPNKSDRGTLVINYRDPNAREFYKNMDYEHASEDGLTPPVFEIDSLDGTITWDAPGMVGEYNIAFEIIENRRKNGVWYQIGFVRRDMQIIVEDCDNNRPDLEVPEDICVVAGESISNLEITATDPDGHDVMIQAFGQILDAGNISPAVLTPSPAVFQDSPASAYFSWNTTCTHVREIPYQVVFKATDKPPVSDRANLATFKVMHITVVGPKPVFQAPVVNTAARSVTLNWQSYACSQPPPSNPRANSATRMQIWRKVEASTYNPDCETGMPEGLGYELVSTIPLNPSVTSFLDNNAGAGLSPGAQYCYRLVAVYDPEKGGGESLVSEEICIDPFPITTPLLTKVSVEKTDAAAGEIQLEWVAPVDYTPNPGPITYNILRGNGFTGAPNPTPIATGLTTLSYLDVGLDTENDIFNYTVQLVDNGTIVDKSPMASTVRLEAEAQNGAIKLTWTAVVPWSNQIAAEPNHIIKRGNEGSTDASLTQYDVVNVTQGFIYIDDGKGVPLGKDETYCYKVETAGGYGNPAIPQILRNNSQMLCAQPGDDIDPCPPLVVQPDVNRCEDYIATTGCLNDEFSNTLRWERPSEECGNDVLYYEVWSANSPNGPWEVLAAKVRDTFYVDNSLARSFARCYRIKAVDRTLNDSEFSDPICVDNCPYFELPNVFTPNGDGCNDLFSAFRERATGEESSCKNIDDIRARCPRFVQSVIFKVYNRWGHEVYEFDSGEGENSIYVDWDGSSTEHRELSTGIYYWVAEVTFNMLDPAKRNKTYKGWVHLIRGAEN